MGTQPKIRVASEGDHFERAATIGLRPSAGINRHEVENERVLQERSSEPS